MFVIDTNILIYAVDKDSSEHAVCREFVDGCRRQMEPWYLTWGIVYEFLRVSTHPRVFRKPLTMTQAWSFLESLFASPSLRVLVETERHLHLAKEVLAETSGATGNLVFDAHTAILMRENGVKTIYTKDTDFKKFAFLETVDPTGV